MVVVNVWQCEGSFFQAQWPFFFFFLFFFKERHLSFALNVELWKLVPNSSRTSCVRISISLKMDPDLISGPDGKQKRSRDCFSSLKNIHLGSHIGIRLRCTFQMPLGPIYF